MQSVGDMFARAVAEHGSRVFLRRRSDGLDERWSYEDAGRRVAALVGALAERGVGRGDRVVVYGHGMASGALFDLACATLGAAHLPYAGSSLPELSDLVRRTGARAVLLTEPLDGGEQLGLPCLALEEMSGAERLPGPDGVDAATARELLAARSAQVEPGDLYMLQPTSGTSGRPKLVQRSHAVFVRVAELLRYGRQRSDEPPERILFTQALTHGFGQYLLALAVGQAAELCLPSAIDVATPLDDVRALDPSFVATTPRVLRSLVAQAGGVRSGERLFGPSARLYLSGGASPDPDLLRALDAQGVAPAEAYGASEFSLVAIAPLGSWQPGVIGKVLDDVELRIADDGEIRVKSPALMRGYEGDAALTARAFDEHGFYRTGDRGELLEGGFLRYQGRLRDTFNLFDGSNVDPEHLEERIAALPWVEQAVLLGNQRPFVIALIAPRAEAAADWAALVRRIEIDVGRANERAPLAGRVRRVLVLDQPLPEELHAVVGHGKVRRRRAEILERHAAAIETVYAGATGIGIPGAGRERRMARRAPATLSVWLRGPDGREGHGETIDVSRTGLLVETSLACDQDAELELRLEGTPVEDEVARARVVRRNGNRVSLHLCAGDDVADFLDILVQNSAESE